MNRFAIVVHGGAGDDSKFLRSHIKENEEGLRRAVIAGYEVLKKGKSALDAVECAVMALEDDPFFNAGRGSALNIDGEVEMDASIMDGKTLKAGAVSMLRRVKNPISLARIIMNKSKHVLLSGYGASKFAIQYHLPIRPAAYFRTRQQLEDYLEHCNHLKKGTLKNTHGTVGAVAIDAKGNLAAATSTGGTSYSLPGRVGDSCIIGAGCYANNKICAISGTGHGEILITGVVANTIALLMELKKMSIQAACDYVLRKRLHGKDIGVIAIDRLGHIGMSFTSQLMKRAWIDRNGKIYVKVY